MIRLRLVLCLLVGLAAHSARAQGPSEADLDQLRQRSFGNRHLDTLPQVEPKKIINESHSFLKEREPEMNTEEYAIYQKVATMLGANPQFAITLLEGMMNEKETPSPAFEFILGNAYYAAGQNEKAVVRYRSAVNRYPSFLRAWSNLGVLFYSTERYAEAVPAFAKAVALGDRDPTTFGLLGYSLEKTGQSVAAEMAYLQALGGAPTRTDWREGLLRLYTAGQQYGRAEDIVRSLIRDVPTETRYWMAYANVLLSQGQKLKAIAMLEVAARRNIAGAEELFLLGDLYAEHHLAAEATATYQKALAVQPALAGRKLLQLAQLLIASGDLAKAEEVLKQIDRASSPEEQIAWWQTRADLLSARKQWAAARAVLDELLRSAPLDGKALLSLGLGYAAENDLDHASFAFESATRVPAAAYRANLELANIELKQRHYAKSIEYLERALSIEKNEGVSDLLARLRLLVSESS